MAKNSIFKCDFSLTFDMDLDFLKSSGNVYILAKLFHIKHKKITLQMAFFFYFKFCHNRKNPFRRQKKKLTHCLVGIICPFRHQFVFYYKVQKWLKPFHALQLLCLTRCIFTFSTK